MRKRDSFIICKECGCNRRYVAHGLCGSCYNRQYYYSKPKNVEKKRAYDALRKDDLRLYARAYYEKNKAIVNLRAYARFEKYKATNLAYLSSVKPIKCEVCGYEKCFAAIELHHLEPEKKNGPGDRLSTWLYGYCPTRFKSKIDGLNFMLLCSNCHKEKHYAAICQECHKDVHPEHQEERPG